MGLKGKIFKFMSDILKDGSYYKLCTQAKSTSACGLPKGFFSHEDSSSSTIESYGALLFGLFHRHFISNQVNTTKNYAVFSNSKLKQYKSTRNPSSNKG